MGYTCAFVTNTSGAEEMARTLYNEVFTKYGFSNSIISDNGPSFSSNLYKCMADKFNIKLKFASCYNPKSSAKAEHANSTILNALRCVTSKEPDNWTTYLSTVTNVINNTPNSTSNINPKWQCSAVTHMPSKTSAWIKMTKLFQISYVK